MSFMESLVFGERIFTISHTMRFDICLGGDIQSILVAQVIPSRVVGIVASAHGIDVELLHDFDVLNHAVDTNHITSLGVKFMTVGTLYQHRLSVYEQLSALNLHLSESNLLAHALYFLSVVLQRDVEGI